MWIQIPDEGVILNLDNLIGMLPAKSSDGEPAIRFLFPAEKPYHVFDWPFASSKKRDAMMQEIWTQVNTPTNIHLHTQEDPDVDIHAIRQDAGITEGDT